MQWQPMRRVAAWQVIDAVNNCATVLHLQVPDTYVWFVENADDCQISEGVEQTLADAQAAAERVMETLG